MTTGYFEMGDGAMYYEVGGAADAEVTLVLNHAGFLDSGMWDAQWEAFTQDFRVLRYDMRGFGNSAPVTAPRCRRDDTRRLLAHLQIERAHFVGCSVGGEIALDLALETPDLVQSLILVNSVPSGFEMQGEPPPYVLAMIGALQTGDFAHASELQLRIWFDGPQRTPDQVDGVVRRQAGGMNLRYVTAQTWLIADSEPATPLMPPAIQRLEAIPVPTLIMTGALDHAENLRASALLAARIPTAQTIPFAHSAHVPNMEEPQAFNAAVMGFVRARQAV